MKRFCCLRVMVLLSVVAACANADEPEFDRCVTLSPFHLLNPELYLQGEASLCRRLSAAFGLGVGQVTDEGTVYDIREMDMQARYYLSNSFLQGFMLGADAGYVDAGGNIKNPMAYLVGLRAGIFAGYKYTTRTGFTFEVLIGPVYVRENEENAEWQTLEGFKLGWSY